MDRVRERTDDAHEQENRQPDRSDGSETSESAGLDTDAAVERAIDRMHERGESVRERELQRALDRLEARGELSAAEREAVVALSERLVDRLLAVPEVSLRAGEKQGDSGRVETALELFE